MLIYRKSFKESWSHNILLLKPFVYNPTVNTELQLLQFFLTRRFENITHILGVYLSSNLKLGK